MAGSVTIVIVVFNRREELREVLRRMTEDSDHEPVDVVVVDNASEDGSAAMVREEFPAVRVIERDTNIGAPAWNDGFDVAQGDYVLILDDDCYLPPDGLRRAVVAAEANDAALVSFRVVSTHDPDFVFTDRYPTGLLSFWGCACLVRRDALRDGGGYDRELFMWANELALTIRVLDSGYRHLHLPEVVAQHMKRPDTGEGFDVKGYRTNSRNWAYVAGKLLRPLDAAAALAGLLYRSVRHALRRDRRALVGVPLGLRGFAHGLRHRRPVNRELSRFYRRNFHSLANPLRMTRPFGDTASFVAARPEVYPRQAAVLDFSESRGRSFSATDSA
jgi:GT2 family glycosyltransferase